MSNFTYEWEEAEFEGIEVFVEFDIECTYTPGTPDVPYLANGDPGFPGDPAEAEVVKVSCTHIVSEHHDRAPLKAEAAYWEERFWIEVSGTDSFMDLLYDEAEKSYHDSLESYWEDRYDEERDRLHEDRY